MYREIFFPHCHPSDGDSSNRNYEVYVAGPTNGAARYTLSLLRDHCISYITRIETLRELKDSIEAQIDEEVRVNRNIIQSKIDNQQLFVRCEEATKKKIN